MTSQRIPGKHGGWASVLFVLSYFVARFILEHHDLTDSVRVLAALLPVGPFAWMLWEIIKGIRKMDELEQRIQLEALAIAFPLSLILMMTLGLLELALELSKDDFSYRHVWAMLPVLYFAGLTFARRRYS